MMGNTPNIRFKGFTDDWEQRKLGEVFQEYSEKNHPELPALTIIQGGGTVLREKSERKLQYDKSSLAWYKMVREDDFIVHLRSFEGGLEKSNHNGLISPAYHTFHGDEVDSRFYYPYFRSYEFIKHKLVPHVYGIRDGRSIDIDGMKTIEIPWTSYEEQKKIGDYIESLDTLITLHQRKCDETKKLKKFMLQKMFPKKDEKKPEIRFAGFTDDWEQRKFPEFVSFYNGLTYTPNDIQEMGTLVLRSSNVKNGEIVDADNVYVNDKVATSENVQVGDIIVVVRNGSRALIGKHAQIKASMPNTVIGAFMSGIRSGQSSFVNALLDTSAFENEIAKNMGATINQITGYMFSKMEFMVPSEEEQQQIGQYFSNLDHLITLHQRKSFFIFSI
jgi:type I restriction enzyme S subunit